MKQPGEETHKHLQHAQVIEHRRKRREEDHDRKHLKHEYETNRTSLAWPSGKYAVMGAAQAANTLLQLEKRQAERAGKEMTDASIAELRERVTESYESQTDIRYGAARGWVDAVIPPHETREVLSLALELVTRPKPAGGFRSCVFQV